LDKSQYFYRAVVFTRKNNQVSLANIHDPQQKTSLDDWPGTVLSLADGLHTIQELIGFMASQYPGNPPAELEKTLKSVFDRLLDGDFIKLSDEKVELPYYLAAPMEELDIEKAKKLMHEDGYTQH